MCATIVCMYNGVTTHYILISGSGFALTENKYHSCVYDSSLRFRKIYVKRYTSTICFVTILSKKQRQALL